MSIKSNKPALGGSAGLLNISGLELPDTANTKQKIEVSQAANLPAHVIEAKRELLRDFAHEAATQAADHAAMLARYIAMDDLPGLKYSAAKFVAFARETAKTCRELIDGGRHEIAPALRTCRGAPSAPAQGTGGHAEGMCAAMRRRRSFKAPRAAGMALVAFSSR